MVRSIPQPAFQWHPGNHAQPLNDELARAVTACFPVQKSHAGRLPRQTWLSVRSLTLMYHRSSGRRELRMLRRRLNQLLLAAAFCAWFTDGEEVEEWLDDRQCRWRW
eukprot:5596788-Pyramimonas_sp.AAC.1